MVSFHTFPLFLSACAAIALTLPHNAVKNALKGSKVEYESSGSEPDEPIRGVVKVVRLDPYLLAQSELFKRGLAHRAGPSLGSRMPFPAFLSRGRAGPALKTPASPLHHLRAESPIGPELKRRQGLHMWQNAVKKGDHGKMSLPLSLKDAAKHTCTAIPFTQRVTAEGCDTVTVPNRLCFGQCGSLFVPSVGESWGQRRGACSRCAPSRARTVSVPLKCGADGAHQKHVMVVEECRCETGLKEAMVEIEATPRL